MRIGIDASLAAGERTGTGSYALHLVKHLLDLDRENEYVLYFRRHCPRINPLFQRAAPNLTKVITEAPSGNLRIQANLAWRLQRDRIDLYHSLGFFLPLLWPGRSVVTMHDVNFLLLREEWWRKGKRIDYILLRLQARLAARRARRIVTVSQWSASSISAAWGVPPQKIVVIPNGLAREPVEGGVNGRGHAEIVRGIEGRRYLLSVSILSPTKNFARLLRAFREFRDRDPGGEDIALVIVGKEDGHYYREVLQPLVRALHLERDVAFTGFVPDDVLRDLYRGAVAFVLPSLGEGFGLTPLEAMAAGLPVVTSNVSALPEVMGEAALLVDPYDISQIARALQEITGNQTLRAELMRRGAERCAAFSWPRAAASTLAVYGAVYNGG